MPASASPFSQMLGGVFGGLGAAGKLFGLKKGGLARLKEGGLASELPTIKPPRRQFGLASAPKRPLAAERRSGLEQLAA